MASTPVPDMPYMHLVESTGEVKFSSPEVDVPLYIKAMFTTTPSSTYTSNWVKGVSPTGTFVKNSAATWTDTFGVDAIPEGWTVELADA